jgi:hypothetical protein
MVDFSIKEEIVKKRGGSGGLLVNNVHFELGHWAL